MLKINTRDVPDDPGHSPGGKYSCTGQSITYALQQREGPGLEQSPFDLEIHRIPPGKTAFPYHAHSAQWEFYHVMSGRGTVRHKDGVTPIEPGDAFHFRPNEPHHLINSGPGEEDLVVYVIANNPVGEFIHYPDSNKWMVRLPETDRIMRSEPVPYYDGEE